MDHRLQSCPGHQLRCRMKRRSCFQNLSFARTICALICATSLASHATEPLHDRYQADGSSGYIYPVECCWKKLPPSERLREIKRAELTGCSAIGGPVGKFENRSGTLWLTGLYRCRGDMELTEVYPELKGPVKADWLNGSFRAQLKFLCYGEDGRRISAIHQELEVEQGVVTSLREKRHDESACPVRSR